MSKPNINEGMKVVKRRAKPVTEDADAPASDIGDSLANYADYVINLFHPRLKDDSLPRLAMCARLRQVPT